MVQVHRDSALLDALLERLPHLAGPEPRVVELLDQRRHLPALQPEDRERRLEQREVLDPLRGPLRPDLRAGDPPDLLAVRLEERVVEPLAEADRHPVLERLGVLAAAPQAPEIRQRAEQRLEDPESCEDVLRLQGIREELAVEVDAREARTRQELAAHHVLPEPLDRLQLREEAVAAEIEAVPVELDRLRDPAHGAVGLEDGARRAPESEDVRGREACGAAAEHGRSERLTALDLALARRVHRPDQI